MPSTEKPAPNVRPLVAVPAAARFLADAGLVVVFAAAGNFVHVSGKHPVDVAGTAWPFLAGLVVGWLITLSWRHPDSLWPRGLVLAAVTVALGLLLRHLFSEGDAPMPFIIVASSVLALLLLGRRFITARLPLPAT